MACFNQEEIPECPHSLAENEDNSEDCDEDEAKELTHLEVTKTGCDG